MRHRLRRILLLVLLPLVAMGGYIGWFYLSLHRMVAQHSQPDPPSAPPTARTPDYLRVLFIGNSFTNFDGGQALLLTGLAESAHEPHLPIAEQVTVNGQSLKYHWLRGHAARRIREGNWDYVVLQDHSTGPVEKPAELRTYATLFDREIKLVGARTVFFMTWARKDEPQNQAVITAAYEAIARELGADVVPVGRAWENAIHQRPQMEFFEYDNKHPNSRGAYLTGCSFYRFFYGHSPRGLAHEFGNGRRTYLAVDDSDAAYLQGVADQSVTQFARYHPTTSPSPSSRPITTPDVAIRGIGQGPGERAGGQQ